MDGSPLLYYMLLSVWMDVVGDGPAATQALSVAISLVSIPGGLWAGWSLFGRRAGLICAALCAVNPFLTAYAQETRMYALMLVMSLLATAAFLHVFAFGRRRYLPLFMVLLAGMLYTHNWGLFPGAAWRSRCPCWYVSEVRSSFWKDALIGFGGALLYLPWVPTLLHQVQHTGAPWLNPPNSGRRSRSRSRCSEAARRPCRSCSPVARGSRRSGAARGGQGAHRADLRRDDRARTLAVAWLVSQVSPAWTTRYLGVLLGPMLLLGALGLARAGNLGLVALAIILVIWAIPKSYGLENKSNAADLRKDSVPSLREGDLVLSMQPEQGPLLAYHLETSGARRSCASEPARARSRTTAMMDWTDGGKLEDATPSATSNP